MNQSLKNFLPLIFIFSIIILFVVIKQLLMPSDLHGMMYDFMGAFFIIFGAFKIVNLSAFAQAYAMYDLLAQKSKLYAYAYPFIEFFLGCLYIVRWHLSFANWATLIVMLISAIGVARALAKQEHITCACLGLVFKIPMTYVTLFEDLLMAGMAGIMLL